MTFAWKDFVGYESIRTQLRALHIQNRFIVYSANIGGYDRTCPAPTVDPKTTICILFTDEISQVAPGWNVIRISGLYRSERRTAKIFKVLPDVFFEEANYSLWVDCNRELVCKMTFFDGYLDGLLWIFSHPKRSSVAEEVRENIFWKKDNVELLKNQLEHILADGYKDDLLLLGSLILRQHNNEKVVNAMRAWWQEIDLWSYRDQISLPAVLRKYDIEPQIFPGEIDDLAVTYEHTIAPKGLFHFYRRVLKRILHVFRWR